MTLRVRSCRARLGQSCPLYPQKQPRQSPTAAAAKGRFCCKSQFWRTHLGPKVFLDWAEAMALRQPHGGAAALTLWNPYATH